MKITREARRISRELFKLCLVKGRVDEARVREVADAVAAEKPRNYVAILKELTRLVRLEIEKRHAVIESAQPLDSQAAQDIQKMVAAKFGGLTAEFRVEPALVGGLRIKVGSDVWDGSIRARLAALKEQL